ncbi:MAG TPA: hypothetical protein GX399_10785 [Xanthomonadaceae bacterium]|nr:hypothetical protein [Xanthomonadaceae bacterium]
MIFLLIAVIGNISGKIEPGSKARIASGVFGLAFILVGILMHVMQSGLNPPASSTASSTSTKPDQPPKTPSTVKPDIPASPASEQRGSESPKKETSLLESQTVFEGVVASISRFEKSGELITLELTLRNIAPDTISYCVEPLYAQLIDEISGESWGELHYGGDVGCHMKQNLAMGQSHTVWMKFKISNPEKKKFAFSLPILRRPIENLGLEGR